MKNLYIIPMLVTLLSQAVKAQQFALFNTHTLFDAYENPAQRAFMSDDAGRYATNFLLPNVSFNGANRGDASYALKNRINSGQLDTRDIPIGTNFRNKLYGSTNMYVFMLRINPFYQNNKELGFSWQVKGDAYADYTNESLVALRNYGRFNASQSDPFNGNAYAQSYHQFSVNYRVDADENIAYGFKLGLLSGITYNHADISQSAVTINQNKFSAQLTGRYRASFLLTDEIDRSSLLPDFKNPGLSLSFGTTYTSSSGVFIMGNIKDLGFIRWNNNSNVVNLDHDQLTVDVGNGGNSKALQRQLVDLLTRKTQHQSFYSPTNARIDFMIGKAYNWYTPNLIISKNIFYRGADVVMVNQVKCEDFSFSLSPAYNMNHFFLLGAQALYQSDRFEIFAGTDNLLQSATLFNQASYASKGTIGASVYMGVGIKFGAVADRP